MNIKNKNKRILPRTEKKTENAMEIKVKEYEYRTV